MSKSSFIWSGIALIVLSVAGFEGWLFSLPPPTAANAPLVPHQEADARLASLKPTRERPLVAVIGINDATETTDHLMPTGILRCADMADVMMVTTDPGTGVALSRARRGATEWPEDRRVSILSDQRSADALDQALEAIAVRYGRRTGNVVAGL